MVLELSLAKKSVEYLSLPTYLPSSAGFGYPIALVCLLSSAVVSVLVLILAPLLLLLLFGYCDCRSWVFVVVVVALRCGRF